VTFEPEGRTVFVPEGRTLLEAAREGGIPLNSPCGGTGTCGGCRIIIPDDPPPPSEACSRVLSGEEQRRGLRLACQQHVNRDLRVVIPEEARLKDQRILTEGAERPIPLDPNCRKVPVRCPEPSVADQRADAERLLDALAEQGLPDLGLGLPLVRDLPVRLRRLGFHAAAVVIGDEVVDLERPGTTSACYGFAVDIGTTTLAGFLVDLTTGRVEAVAARTNPQTAYGDDVVARIEHCMRRKDGLRTLHAMIVEAINEMVAEACRRAHVRPSAVYEVAAVGNTTMNHLLLGLPVDAIGRAPFVPASSSAQSVKARQVGLRVNRYGRLYTAPVIGSFVGADTVAVILATGMHESDRLRLAIDVGTNGEIVLGHGGRLLACSTAAGPAFEGARIRYGMRAAAGAIDRVDLDGDRLLVHTIDEAPPIGLCGTGLVDAVAVLLEAEVVSRTGSMRRRQDLAGRTPLAERITGADGDVGFVLADADSGRAGHPILLTQRDVRQLQLAKGAIAAGIHTLLAEFGARLDDLEEILLAGAFGNLIRPERARAIGLVPPLALDRIRFVGNAAGVGARMLLVNRALRRTADDVACGVEHVELSQRPDFQDRFAEAMLFP
jgi:uncharacterized 2Fe-2S/4Fe-4S cluster protein (DUF4445 family)